MEQYGDIVERYTALWNERDAARRRVLIAQAWTEDASYRDPMSHAQGHKEIEVLVQEVQQQFPGYRFRQIGAVDGHHFYVRFSWELGPADGPAPIAGSDVVILAADGRLEQVIGVLDRVPVNAAEA